jgi:hypothetical protein
MGKVRVKFIDTVAEPFGKFASGSEGIISEADAKRLGNSVQILGKEEAKKDDGGGPGPGPDANKKADPKKVDKK